MVLSPPCVRGCALGWGLGCGTGAGEHNVQVDEDVEDEEAEVREVGVEDQVVRGDVKALGGEVTQLPDFHLPWSLGESLTSGTHLPRTCTSTLLTSPLWWVHDISPVLRLPVSLFPRLPVARLPIPPSRHPPVYRSPVPPVSRPPSPRPLVSRSPVSVEEDLLRPVRLRVCVPGGRRTTRSRRVGSRTVFGGSSTVSSGPGSVPGTFPPNHSAEVFVFGGGRFYPGLRVRTVDRQRHGHGVRGFQGSL